MNALIPICDNSSKESVKAGDYRAEQTIAARCCPWLEPAQRTAGGALAAVGLRLSGNDGRVRGKARMTGECATVAELLEATGFDRVCAYGHGMLDGNCNVELNSDEVKAVFQNFSRTVLAVPTPNGQYRLLEKRHLMRY